MPFCLLEICDVILTESVVPLSRGFDANTLRLSISAAKIIAMLFLNIMYRIKFPAVFPAEGNK